MKVSDAMKQTKKNYYVYSLGTVEEEYTDVTFSYAMGRLH